MQEHHDMKSFYQTVPINHHRNSSNGKKADFNEGWSNSKSPIIVNSTISFWQSTFLLVSLHTTYCKEIYLHTLQALHNQITWNSRAEISLPYTIASPVPWIFIRLPGVFNKTVWGLSSLDSKQSKKLTLGAMEIRLSDLQCFNCFTVAGAFLVSWWLPLAPSNPTLCIT